jgi:hypothetical protein
MLSADAGPWRIYMASDGRKLKGRPAGETPNWTDLQEPARGFTLESVDLKGHSRRVVASLTVLADSDGQIDVDF